MLVIKRIKSILSSGGIRGLMMATQSYLAHHSILIHALAACRTQYYRHICGYNAVAAPFALLEVDPNSITRSNRSINKYYESGTIRGGEWDLECSLYEQSDKYRSVKQRFVDGKSWEETDIHPILSEKIERTGEADGCFSRADLKDRYERIDRLYESMSTYGYDPTRGTEGQESRLSSTLDHICVSIGRNGEFVFCGGGNHRFSIAKILEVESIPVRIVIRHTKWQQKREDVAAGAVPEVTHPDLQKLYAKPT